MVKQRRGLMIVVASLVAIVAVGALVAVQQLGGNGTTTAADTASLQNVAVAKQTLQGIPETKGVLGDPSAPMTVHVYGDLRCPVCRQWDAQEAPDVIANVVRPGKAKLDLRLWAILGPNSEAAHRAGYAAMQQNKLWLYATIVYYNQGDEQSNWFTDDFADAVAQAAGLDLKKFDADRKSSAADQMIAEVDSEASAQGFTGTPTIGVGTGNGPATYFNGVPTAADIQQAVAAGLQ
jgi:protein-disulfide isomerase